MSYDFLWLDKHTTFVFTLKKIMILYCIIVFTCMGRRGEERMGWEEEGEERRREGRSGEEGREDGREGERKKEEGNGG